MKKNPIDPSDAARALQAMRKTRGAGTGRPRAVAHDPEAKYCICIDCRRLRGHYPADKNTSK